MGSDPKKKRPRTSRRAAERELEKLAEDRERLATLEPGGTPERPIEVRSPAQIETRALGMGCVHCDGDLELVTERVQSRDGERLRELDLRCRRCHRQRPLYFRVAPPLVN